MPDASTSARRQTTGKFWESRTTPPQAKYKVADEFTEIDEGNEEGGASGGSRDEVAEGEVYNKFTDVSVCVCGLGF